MKKQILLIFTILCGAVALNASPLIPFTLGLGFPNYKNTYMLVGTGAYFPMDNNIEFSMTGAFGIRTDTDNSGNVDADFLIPFNTGINFLFPVRSNLTFVSAFGLNALMEFTDSVTLHMGPYIKGGVRYRVHKNMQLTLELQQDLLFGPPRWINTTTLMGAGIVFNLN